MRQREAEFQAINRFIADGTVAAVLAEATPTPVETAADEMKLAVDADGFCWRVFEDGTWSMARTNPDNSPIPQPVTYYTPKTPSPIPPSRKEVGE